MKSLESVLASIPSITLDELNVVDFEKRMDTKYIFPASKVISFLENIMDDIVILQIGNIRHFHYENVYFDQANYEFFRKHHAGHLNRLKIRARKYDKAGPTFLEIKRKSNKALTNKVRLSLADIDQVVNEESDQFLKTELGFGFDQLPSITEIAFDRFTLSNKSMTEKFTLDVNLEARYQGESHLFKNLAIAEVKQERFTNNSSFIRSLRALKVHPKGFSKYCNAVMQFHPELKQNRFKPLTRTVKKIENYGAIAE